MYLIYALLGFICGVGFIAGVALFFITGNALLLILGFVGAFVFGFLAKNSEQNALAKKMAKAQKKNGNS